MPVLETIFKDVFLNLDRSVVNEYASGWSDVQFSRNLKEVIDGVEYSIEFNGSFHFDRYNNMYMQNKYEANCLIDGEYVEDLSLTNLEDVFNDNYSEY